MRLVGHVVYHICPTGQWLGEEAFGVWSALFHAQGRICRPSSPQQRQFPPSYDANNYAQEGICRPSSSHQRQFPPSYDANNSEG